MGEDTLTVENSWQTCWQNLLNVFDVRHYAVKLLSPQKQWSELCNVCCMTVFWTSVKPNMLHTGDRGCLHSLCICAAQGDIIWFLCVASLLFFFFKPPFAHSLLIHIRKLVFNCNHIYIKFSTSV
jgi:hypothetical protein